MQYSSGEVSIADYDGNGLNEIILAGMKNEGHDYGDYVSLFPCVSVWDPYNEGDDNFISTYPVDDYEFPLMNSEETVTDTGHLGFYLRNAVGFAISEDIDGSGSEYSLYIGAFISNEFSLGWGSSHTRGTDLTYTANVKMSGARHMQVKRK